MVGWVAQVGKGEGNAHLVMAAKNERQKKTGKKWQKKRCKKKVQKRSVKKRVESFGKGCRGWVGCRGRFAAGRVAGLVGWVAGNPVAIASELR